MPNSMCPAVPLAPPGRVMDVAFETIVLPEAVGLTIQAFLPPSPLSVKSPLLNVQRCTSGVARPVPAASTPFSTTTSSALVAASRSRRPEPLLTIAPGAPNVVSGPSRTLAASSSSVSACFHTRTSSKVAAAS